MKTPEEITQDVLDGMLGIGGCLSNEEFYAEFDDRLRRALSIANVVRRSEQLKCEHQGRGTATELVEYCEDCKKILFHP